MCLHKLVNFPVNRNYGYKIFKLDKNENLYHEFFHPSVDVDGFSIYEPLPMLRWIDRNCREPIKTLLGPYSYETGFHIYKNLITALFIKNYFEPTSFYDCIRRVYFDRVLYTGTEVLEIPVIVANRIFITHMDY